jgi:very-short-patch-repair endonuclease
MIIFNANHWEDYDTYIAKKRAKSKHAEKKKLSKKEKNRKLEAHNSTIKEVARYYAQEMKQEPSALERRMQDFLDNRKVQYEFQKPLYIKKKNTRIRKFYIADFYIPDKNLIIETDGKFHDNQIIQDERRTKDIQKFYPNIRILRWRWHDFDSPVKLEELMSYLH